MGGGILKLSKTPDLIVIYNNSFEPEALKESLNLNIPVISFVNTQDPAEKIEYKIPAGFYANESGRMYYNLLMSSFTNSYYVNRSFLKPSKKNENKNTQKHVNKDKRLTIKGPISTRQIVKNNVKFIVSGNFLIIEMKSNVSNFQMVEMKRLIEKNIQEVRNNFKKSLELVGVGYRAYLFKNYFVLKLGYSHLIYVNVPKTIQIICIRPTKVYIIGANKEEINLFAKLIKAYKKPEPYKGKGFLYEN